MDGHDDHVTFQMLWEQRKGKLSRDDLLDYALDHLARKCPTCREEMMDFEVALFTIRPSWLSCQAWRALPAHLAKSTPAERRQMSQARREVAYLRRLSTWEERIARVNRARRWYRHEATAYALLDETRRNLDEPQAAENWAHLAMEVAYRAGNAQRDHRDAWVLSLAHQANALRAMGRLQEAGAIFHQCEAFAKFLRGEPYAVAEISWLHAVLLRDQGSYSASSGLLDKAVSVYRALGETRLAARTLVTLTLTQGEAGKDMEASEAGREALALLRGDRDNRLKLFAAHSLAAILCLTESGYVEAREVYEKHAELYRRFPESRIQTQRLWLLGRLTTSEGNLLQAEQYLEQAREGLAKELNAYDTAAVGLELALVYLKRGKLMTTRKLALEMIREFRRVERADRETQAALLLFGRAVRAERVTKKLVRSLGRHLARARRNLGLEFR